MKKLKYLLLILLIAGGDFVEMYLERYGMQGYIYSGILCVVLFIALFFILLFIGYIVSILLFFVYVSLFR